MVSDEQAGAPVLPPKQFQLVGGDLCLDFCNTVGGKRGVVDREYLNGYLDLLSWSRQAGLVDGPTAGVLARRSAKQAREAAAVLLRGIRLREALYRIFLALMDDKRPAAVDLETLNGELAVSLGGLRVVRQEGNHFAWGWCCENGALDQVLAPVARSAAELLTAHERWGRVRQCKGDTCGWLFIDSSKNHSRCWCDMRDCGNRAKVRRHRLKKLKIGNS